MKVPEEWKEGLYQIDFAPTKRVLLEIPEAIRNRISRERFHELQAIHPSLPMILRSTTQVADTTWNSIRFLCSDGPELPSRQSAFAIAVPPLARTFLDSLFTVIFVFDSPTRNVRWFAASGWRELHGRHERMKAKHGSDPVWADWLKQQADFLQFLDETAQITAQERQVPKSVPWWPNPGKMPSMPLADGSRRDFLLFLNDWFYKDLSADSHLSLLGIVDRAGPWMQTDTERREYYLWRYKSRAVFRAVALFLALLSEISCQLNFAHEAGRLRDIWRHFELWPEVQELYNIRYDSLLAQAGG